MKRYILAIDPGNAESAYCLIETPTLRPLKKDKVENDQLREILQNLARQWEVDVVVIERVASYGMAVGREVFETCEWVGRFSEIAESLRIPCDYVYRQEEKRHICHDSRAKDANIRRALIDRFARHDLANGKGTKCNPDWFYGFKSDCWAAYAAGITYAETKLGGITT